MTRALFCLPAIDRNFATACVEGMAPEVRAHTMVVDNTRRGFTSPFVRFVRYFAEGGINRGTARSWNMARAAVIEEEYDWLVLLSAAVRFGPPGGTDLLTLLDELDEVESEISIALPAPQFWHTCCIRREALETLGEFDENFYPFHFEDTDYRYRARLAGLVERKVAEVDIGHVRDGHGNDALRRENPGQRVLNMEALGAYYRDKWGGDPDHELFWHPYGDPANGIGYWKPCTIDDLKERYGLAP